MISDFDGKGNLPPGVYEASIQEIEKRFGGSISLRRSKLTKTLKRFINFLKFIAIEVYIDGSYTTGKLSPTDVDMLIILPKNYLSDFSAVARMLYFYTHQKNYDLHIFNCIKGKDDELFNKRFDWFTHDRSLNEKGIIKLRM